MNRNDFKNPLIQSGIVIIVVFLLISIVANSGGGGIIGSIGSLISGLFSGIVFIIGLCLAIIISIAIIIGLFIAAVAIHSTDKARNMLEQLFASLASFYEKFRGAAPSLKTGKKERTAAEHTAQAASPAAEPSAARQTGQPHPLQEAVSQLQATVLNLQTASTETSAAIATLREQVAAAQEPAQLAEQLAALENHQQELAETLTTRFTELATQLETTKTQLKDLEKSLAGEQKQIRDDLQELQKKTSVPEVISGILSYIDKPEDREKITEKAEEAVARGMTYAQIDDFFKSSLTPSIYKILAAHPRLTKDFIRSIKKKF